METDSETTWKLAHQLEVGDKTRAFGWASVVTKVELTFHYQPDARARIELIIADSGEKAVLMLPRGVAVEILK